MNNPSLGRLGVGITTPGSADPLIDGKHSRRPSFERRIPMMLEPDWESSEWLADPKNPVPPRLLRYPCSEVDRWIVSIFTTMGWKLPAPIEELTKEQLEAASARVSVGIRSDG